MKLLTFDPKKNKRVLCGDIIGDALFRNVSPQHFMRVLQGYGIQEIAFQAICERGLKRIILKETHTDKKWEASVEDWLTHSKVADYGHGKQRFLSLKFMNSKKTNLDIIK